MLRIFRAPNGRTYQYEDGRQPAGYEPADAKAKPAANKSRRAANKKVAAEKKD